MLSRGELRVEVFTEVDAEFVAQGFEVFEVFFVLAFVFDFGFDGCGGRGRSVSEGIGFWEGG